MAPSSKGSTSQDMLSGIASNVLPASAEEGSSGSDVERELPPEDPTAAHLLALSHIFFATINLRQFPPEDNARYSHAEGHIDIEGRSFPCMQPHLAHPMQVEHADAPIYDETNLLHHFQGMVREHPDLRVDVQNSSVWFYGAYATVWCWLEMNGLSNIAECAEAGGNEGLAGRREAVAVLFWEKLDHREGDGEEEWVCTRHKALRRSAGF